MSVQLKYTTVRDRSAGGQFTPVYPFATTKLGKRFILKIEKDDETYYQDYSRLRAAAYAYFRRTKQKFACRQIEGGIEVRRIL